VAAVTFEIDHLACLVTVGEPGNPNIEAIKFLVLGVKDKINGISSIAT
jgi:hypothetical protein